MEYPNPPKPAVEPVCDASDPQTSPNDVCATQPQTGAQQAAPLLPDSQLPASAPTGTRQPATGNQKRRYTVSAKVLAANRAKLAKAMAVPKEIRLRETPRRIAARMQNLAKAQAHQRDPHTIPGGLYIHGAYAGKRSAPLAGDDGSKIAHLQQRLCHLFPPQTEGERRRLDRVCDRMGRVWRVMACWEHRERVAFYAALYRAAAEPQGGGLERVERLAEWLEAAVGLSRYDLGRWEDGLRKECDRLDWALRGWSREVEHGPAKPRSGGSGGIKAWETPMSELWEGDGEWNREVNALLRGYALQPWAMPPMDAHGYRVHAWLLRAAVVGGDRASQELDPALGEALAKLAIRTWTRLWGVHQMREEAWRSVEEGMRKWEHARENEDGEWNGLRQDAGSEVGVETSERDDTGASHESKSEGQVAEPGAADEGRSTGDRKREIDWRLVGTLNETDGMGVVMDALTGGLRWGTVTDCAGQENQSIEEAIEELRAAIAVP